MPQDRLSAKRISRLMRSVPWLADVIRCLYRVGQARFTAGVVGVILNDESRLLLVEHVFHPRFPWGLPGGWLERAEDPAGGLQRELREELGLEIAIICPVAVETGHYFRSHLDIAYLCRARSDIRFLSTELLDYRWAPFGDLPSLPPFHQAAVTAAEARRQDEA